jgi:hypothetical protein
MFAYPEITQEGIKCEECGKWFKKLTHCHLFKMHGLTITEYKDKYGLCLKQPLEALYIKELRQAYNKEYNATEMIRNNPKSVPFKKGMNTWGNRKIPAQMTRQMIENGKKMVAHTDESRAKIGEATKRLWQDPEYAAKFKSNEKHLTPEFRERMSKQAREFLSDPEAVAALAAKRKAIWNTPEKKAYASERSKRYWANKKLKDGLI